MSDSEEDIFLTQSSFNGSINSCNDLENLLGTTKTPSSALKRQQKGCLSEVRDCGKLIQSLKERGI